MLTWSQANTIEEIRRRVYKVLGAETVSACILEDPQTYRRAILTGMERIGELLRKGEATCTKEALAEGTNKAISILADLLEQVKTNPPDRSKTSILLPCGAVTLNPGFAEPCQIKQFGWEVAAINSKNGIVTLTAPDSDERIEVPIDPFVVQPSPSYPE